MIFGCDLKINERQTFRIKKLYPGEEHSYARFIYDVGVKLTTIILIYAILISLGRFFDYNATVLTVKCEIKNDQSICKYLIYEHDTQPYEIIEEGPPKNIAGDYVKILPIHFRGEQNMSSDLKQIGRMLIETKNIMSITPKILIVLWTVVISTILIDMLSIQIIGIVLSHIEHNNVEGVKND
jgi:hypothetical protein